MDAPFYAHQKGAWCAWENLSVITDPRKQKENKFSHQKEAWSPSVITDPQMQKETTQNLLHF